MQETQETHVRYLGREDPLEKEMATHTSILVWKIPWTEEPGGLQSMWCQSQTGLSTLHRGLTDIIVFIYHSQPHKGCGHCCYPSQITNEESGTERFKSPVLCYKSTEAAGFETRLFKSKDCALNHYII